MIIPSKFQYNIFLWIINNKIKLIITKNKNFDVTLNVIDNISIFF